MKRISLDYRHLVCSAITIFFLSLSKVLFSNAFVRLLEGFRDFGISCAYYVLELLEIPHTLTPTVNDLSAIPAVELIPDSWEGFQDKWTLYWQLWADWENFKGYFSAFGTWLGNAAKILLLVLPLFLAVYLIASCILYSHNNDYNKDSVPLCLWKKLSSIFYRPVKRWVLDFIAFLKEHSVCIKLWLAIWAYNFNFFTIGLEFIAFYLYFIISFDVTTLYRQVYKLFLDLSTLIGFFPPLAWLLAAFGVLILASRNIAYARLAHHERCNRGFINERGVVTILYGSMGSGKTMLASDMALSAEVQLRDQAFEIILESDMKFPYFPWINLENDLKRAIEYHVVYDVWSCRRWLRKKHSRWQKNKCREKLFGYDERYGLTYDDKLKLVDLWQVLEDYACAYLVYTVQSSLIVSNYSIRVDNLVSDLGNFPLWDCDFFRRDSRLLDSFSRHSHILDFDMLRLGKKMLEHNPNRNAYGFGVYVITEIDKERKNAPELMEVKKGSDVCNQKNDLFNVMLKMSRHAVVIANRVFVKVIGDLQRPESLGADARELGEVVYINGQTDMQPVLPFFSPFWLFELIHLWLKSKFDSMYMRYRYTRGDNTLIVYWLKSIVSLCQHHYERCCNLFGCSTLALEVENGRMDGEPQKKKYYRQSKKIFAKRYATDCLSGIFEARGECNAVGIDDLREYADLMATNEELMCQESHFQTELTEFRQGN